VAQRASTPASANAARLAAVPLKRRLRVSVVTMVPVPAPVVLVSAPPPPPQAANAIGKTMVAKRRLAEFDNDMQCSPVGLIGPGHPCVRWSLTSHQI
jgi:hypothetical protein